MATKKLPPLAPVALPTLAKAAAPAALAMPKIEKPKSIAEIEAERIANINPLEKNIGRYSEDGNAEHDLRLDMEVIADEFAAHREARKRQAEAVELANETEFWCAFYFQTREQSEAFCAHFGLSANKYVDGNEAAAKMGVPLPERTAPYKVGAIDKKLADLT